MIVVKTKNFEFKVWRAEKTNLFDFGEVELESGVDPGQDLRSAYEVS